MSCGPGIVHRLVRKSSAWMERGRSGRSQLELARLHRVLPIDTVIPTRALTLDRWNEVPPRDNWSTGC